MHPYKTQICHIHLHTQAECVAVGVASTFAT
jgi:hypothetical protein